MSEPTPELLNRIELERVERSRQMEPLEKLMAGPSLFDVFLERHTWGLRHEHPEADDEAIRAMLVARVRELQDQDGPDEHP